MQRPAMEWWRPGVARDLPEPAAPEAGGAPRPGLSFWALMAFTFILLLAPQERIPALAPLRIAMAAAALAVGAHVLTRLVRGRAVIDFTPAMGFLAGLLAWALVTLPFSQWPGGSLSFLTGDFLKTVVIFVLLANVIDSLPALKRTVWALVLMAIPLALVTVKNFAAGVVLETGDRVAGYTSGLTANPNDMALMLNLILPLCIGLFLASRSARWRLALGLVACLLIGAVVATFSRGGFLTLVVIALCYAWRLRQRPERRWLVAAALAGLLALPLLPSQYFDRISTIVHIEEDRTHSAQTRLSDLKAALSYSAKNPVFGAGIGMGALAMNAERGEMWTEVHNVYLQILVELGLPGLLLYLLLFRQCFRATGAVIRRHAGQASGNLMFHIAEGLRISLIAFAVAALFHPVAYHFYFYYIAGLALAAGGIAARGAGFSRGTAVGAEARGTGARGQGDGRQWWSP